MNNKIMITGGAGFIGSNLSDYIINNTEDDICIVDNYSYAGNENNLNLVKNVVPKRAIIYNCDICNIYELNQIFERFKPTHVLHLAAETHVDNSIINPGLFINTNIVGTFNMLESTKLYYENLTDKLKQKFKFIHISTDEVFGDLKINSERFKENTPYNPSSPYSASKASSDLLVKSWYRTYKLPTIVTNCSNNYGPRQYPEKLIPLTITHALQNKQIPIYGTGKQIRDWLYVEDHASALYLILQHGIVGESYNIGGDNEIQNIDIVNNVLQLLDQLYPKSDKKSYKQLITYVEDRPGHDIRYAINANKIKNQLGWKPKESFKTGIEKTVQWYLKNYMEKLNK